MLYLITGQDDFLKRQHLQEALNFYFTQKPHYETLDLEEEKLSFDEFYRKINSLIKNQDLFSHKKLILIKNFFSFFDEKSVTNFLKKIDPLAFQKSLMIIFFEKEDYKNKKVFDWFKENKQKVKICEKLTEQKFGDLIDKLTLKYHFTLSKEAKSLLVNAFYPETIMISEIIKKLSLIDKKFIDEKTLKEYVFLPYQPNIFNFLDYLAAGNLKKAYEILEEMEQTEGYHPLYILKMITQEIRNLIIVKYFIQFPELRKKTAKNKSLSLHPYVVKKLTPLSRRFSLEQLKKHYQMLIKYNKKIKEGLIDANLSLELILLEISDSAN